MLHVYAVDITIEWALLIYDKMAKKLIFEEVNFPIEEELEIILIKGFDVKSQIKGYITICMYMYLYVLLDARNM